MVKARLYLGHGLLSLCDLRLLCSDHLLHLGNLVTKTIDNGIPVCICHYNWARGLAFLLGREERRGSCVGLGLSV